VKIDETSADGSWIRFENTNDTHAEDIGGNILRRKVDNHPEIVYTFPRNTIIQSGHRLTLWANGHKGTHNPPESLVFGSITSWGDGHTVVTTLEEDGKVRARNTRTMEQHSIEQHSSASIGHSHGGVALMINGSGSHHHLSSSGGGGLYRESSYSALNNSGSHHDLSGHSSTVEMHSGSGGASYGALRRSEGKTLYQQKMVSSGGDEIGLLHHDSHGYMNGGGSASKSYIREVSSSSSKVSGGGSASMHRSVDHGGQIASVTSMVGKYEANSGSIGGGHQKVHHKFQRHQRTWDNGESAI